MFKMELQSIWATNEPPGHSFIICPCERSIVITLCTRASSSHLPRPSSGPPFSPLPARSLIPFSVPAPFLRYNQKYTGRDPMWQSTRLCKHLWKPPHTFKHGCGHTADVCTNTHTHTQAHAHTAPADCADWIRRRALRHQTPLRSSVL